MHILGGIILVDISISHVHNLIGTVSATVAGDIMIMQIILVLFSVVGVYVCIVIQFVMNGCIPIILILFHCWIEFSLVVVVVVMVSISGFISGIIP